MTASGCCWELCIDGNEVLVSTGAALLLPQCSFVVVVVDMEGVGRGGAFPEVDAS